MVDQQLILRRMCVVLSSVLILSLCSCGGTSSSSSTSIGPSPNPMPSISTLSPPSATAGTAGQTLTINGTSFLSSSAVTFNNVAHVATFVSATQLTIQLTANDQAVAGIFALVVTNPSPGGGASNSLNFTVNNPTPQITSVSPTTLAVGSPATTITVAGSNFVATSQILLNGTASATKFVSSSGLTASNPSPGGGTSTAAAVQLVSVASLALIATPATAAAPSGPWQMFVMAEDVSNDPIEGLPITVTTTQGTLSESQGMTDAKGSFSSTVTPPVGISPSDAVGLVATIGGQSVSATISFSGTSVAAARAGNSAAALRTKLRLRSHANAASMSTVSAPLAFGLSTAAPGSTAPFAAPNACYTFTSLSNPVSAQCAALFEQEGFSLQPFNPFQAGCTLANVASTIFDLGECVGAFAAIPVCVAAAIGTPITVGGSDLLCAGYVALVEPTLGKDCAEFILNEYINHYSKSAKATAELVELSIDPIATDPLDYAVTYCDNFQPTTGQSGSTVAVMAGNGSQGFTNGPSLSIALNSPTGVAIDSEGNVYFDDDGNNVIRILTTASAPAEVSTYAGTGTAAYTGDGGPASAATLNHPTHLAFDANFNLYIADADNNVVRKITRAGVITTVAGTGVAGFSGDGSAATQAMLNFPDSVALDGTGNLYIADASNNRIRKVTPAGIISTVAGNGVGGYGGDNGPATSAELNEPTRVVLDATGNLYISDLLNNRVREVDSSTGTITTLAGNGVAGYQGDGNPASTAELNEPLSVALDSFGNLYIADLGNRVIRVVNMQSSPITLLGVSVQPGDIATVVGGGTQSDLQPGASLGVALSYPTGLSVDAAGNLYFADADNNIILRASAGN